MSTISLQQRNWQLLINTIILTKTKDRFKTIIFKQSACFTYKYLNVKGIPPPANQSYKTILPCCSAGSTPGIIINNGQVSLEKGESCLINHYGYGCLYGQKRGYSLNDVLVFPIGIAIRSLNTKYLSEKNNHYGLGLSLKMLLTESLYNKQLHRAHRGIAE